MRKLLLLPLIMVFGLMACNRNLDEIEMNRNILTPLAYSSISIKDLVTDSSLVENADGSLSMIFREEAGSFGLAGMLDTMVKIKPFKQTLTLESLELMTLDITQKYTMGEMLEQANLGFTPPDGSIIPGAFLPTEINDLPPIELDISEFLVEAVLDSGFLDLTFENQFPIKIESVQIEIRNTDDNTLVLSETFTDIDTGSTQSRTIDLAQQLNGDPIKGELTATLSQVKLESQDGKAVPINYEDYIALNAKIRDVKVHSATAVYPEQEVLYNADDVKLIGLDQIELTEGVMRAAGIKVEAFNTLPDTLYIDYELPRVTKNGVPFTFAVAIPPSENGQPNKIEQYFNFDGYNVDFRGENLDTVNAFYNIVSGHIKQSEEPISLSLDDTLSIFITMETAVPEYLKGYLGNSIETFKDSTTFDLPDFLNDGQIQFEQVNANLVIENGIGATGKLTLNKMDGYNTSSGATASLSAINNSVDIPKSTDNFPSLIPTASVTTIPLQGATDMINESCNLIVYDLEAELNPNGNVPAYNNFVYYDSEMKASLEVEIPLKMSIDALMLSDTVDFKEVNDVEGITSGTLFLLADNGFPIQLQPKLYFLDEFGNLSDSLSTDEMIEAGIVDVATGKVESITESRLAFSFDQTRIENILGARKVIIEATFDTPNQAIRALYSDYVLDLKLTAKFNYRSVEGL